MAQQRNYFHFQPLPTMKFTGFENQDTQDLLEKWSMKDGMKIQGFTFGPQYKDYLQAEFVLDFFSDDAVLRSLEVKSTSTLHWSHLGFKANCVRQSVVPCTKTTTDLFESLKKDEIVVRQGGSIVKCLPEFIRPPVGCTSGGGTGDCDEEPEIEIGNLLQKYVLKTLVFQSGNPLDSEFLDRLESDDEKENLEGLLTKEESGEFLFQIFSHLVIGGSLCQYEDSVLPYIQVTKKLYKDLVCVGVEKNDEEEKVSVKSLVMKIHCVSQHETDDAELDHKNNLSGKPSLIFSRPRLNNFMYIIVDPLKSLIYTFYHQVV